MKKAYLAGFAMAAIVAGVFGVMHSDAASATKLTPLQMRNIEVLSDNEGSGGNERISCNSQAMRDDHYSYTDCASCSRITGYRGLDPLDQCTRRY